MIRLIVNYCYINKTSIIIVSSARNEVYYGVDLIKLNYDQYMKQYIINGTFIHHTNIVFH